MTALSSTDYMDKMWLRIPTFICDELGDLWMKRPIRAKEYVFVSEQKHEAKQPAVVDLVPGW